MKFAILGSLMVLAQASGALAAQPLEAVLVTSVKISGNHMPTIGTPRAPDKTEIIFQALSGGCTDANSFKIVVEEKGTLAKVSLVRVKPDGCEAFPHPVTLTLTTTEINGDSQVKIENPIAVERNFVY